MAATPLAAVVAAGLLLTLEFLLDGHDRAQRSYACVEGEQLPGTEGRVRHVSACGQGEASWVGQRGWRGTAAVETRQEAAAALARIHSAIGMTGGVPLPRSAIVRSHGRGEE